MSVNMLGECHRSMLLASQPISGWLARSMQGVTSALVDHLYHDPRLADFYDLENAWGPEDDCCRALARDASSVLDLGCGTGRLASALASDGRMVVGVDPAAAMLDIARSKNSGGRASWVRGDARNVRLDRKFDLILLTGHAFQVFLTWEDQMAVLKTIAMHLAPEGRFIFDMRNPLAKEWLEWGAQDSIRFLAHPKWGEVKAWNTAVYDQDAGHVTYDTNYLATSTGQLLSANSMIQFTPQPVLAAMIADCGLMVDQWLGDWEGNPFTSASREIIPIGLLAF
jgi:SAM-dependent methyltransferase